MSKKIKLALAAAFLGMFSMSAALACPGHDKEKQAAAEQPKQAEPGAHVTTAAFRVEGMHCAGCADEIKTALGKAGGVLKVDVKVADHRVMVSFDSDKISAEKIAQIITEAGFRASAEV